MKDEGGRRRDEVLGQVNDEEKGFILHPSEFILSERPRRKGGFKKTLTL
jgi:hypothetical protein